MNHRQRQGFTLIEMLISMSLLVLLGMMIVYILRDASNVWRYTQGQSILHSRMRSTLKVIREDIQSIFTGSREQDLRFLLNRDLNDQAQLRFIRRLPEESSHIVFRNAGKSPVHGQKGHKEYYTFPGRAKDDLRAMGGLGEVFYGLSPKDSNKEVSLLRGFRAPIGGVGSFYQQVQQAPKDVYPILDGVLFFQIKVWGQSTISWNERGGKKSAPTFWDSAKRKNDFPIKLQIHLIAREENSPQAILAQSILEDDEVIYLREYRHFFAPPEQKQRFVKISSEWISYSRYEDGVLSGVKRGALGTRAASHDDGIFVKGGNYSTITVQLPSANRRLR